jgi:hypothetical protein
MKPLSPCSRPGASVAENAGFVEDNIALAGLCNIGKIEP